VIVPEGRGDVLGVIDEPFMVRALDRAQVRGLVAHGLALADGSHEWLLGLFGLADPEYLRFTDFSATGGSNRPATV